MANDLGYEIIRDAVPVDLVAEVCESLEGQPSQIESAKFVQFGVPATAHKVYESFKKNHYDKVKKFAGTVQIAKSPKIDVGKFRSLNADRGVLSSSKSYVLVTIALTDLKPSTGWYTICEGSHRLPRTTPVSEVKKRGIDLDLFAGDAIIMWSTLGKIDTPGEGGIFEILSYET